MTAQAAAWQVMSTGPGGPVGGSLGLGLGGPADYSLSTPAPAQWSGVPVLAKTGTDLLLHPCHGSRGGGLGGAGVAGEGGGGMPGHPGLDSSHMPGSTVMFNNVNSFYTPHQPFNSLFTPSSYTVHHPATVRPTSRDIDMTGGGGQGPGGPGAAIRHPSGGSVGSHTPPSPEERAAYTRPAQAPGQRGSFEARQCNSVGSDGQAGSSPGAGYRLLQPPSPASQKSPFDMTTMGMSKSLGSSYTSTSHVSNPSTGSAFQRTGGQVISAASRIAGSPYSIKQEPGSPASASGARPAMMKTSASPASPASPPPVTAGARLGAPGSNGAGPGQGFNFPSPQANNNSHPISPAAGESTTAAGVNNNNSSNNNHPRPGVSSKFRYPSGPTTVQTMSPGESNTSNSAMSSREGTPGPGARPSWCGADATEVGPNTVGAPNIDISNVTVKEEFVPGQHSLARPAVYDHGVDDYTRRPSVNLSYPPISSAGVSVGAGHIDSYSHLSSSGYPTYHHTMPQQVSLPPGRFHHPMRPGPVHPGLHGPTSIPGRPLSLPGGGEGSLGSSHSNVKIGRRPAHLPKVLKFSDTTLPHGWVRKLKQRKHGKQAGRWDVYIYSPCGVKFASRKKLRNFFDKNNLQYDPEDFDFTPYGRHIEAGGGGGGHGGRHLSSSDTSSVGRSPSSVASPTTSYNTPAGLHQDYKPDFMGQSSSGPPTAHRPHSYIHPHLPHPQPPPPVSMFSQEYNPMMESPPNANALEVPQHQILNLSQPQILPNSLGTASSGASRTTAPSTTAPASSFPADIATILNEPSDNHFRPSLRDPYGGAGGGPAGPGGSHLIARGPGPGEHLGPGAPVPGVPGSSDGDNVSLEEGAGPGGHTGGGPGAADKKSPDADMGNDENRFMTRTYNLLTASQNDLGDMMDEYSIYTE